MLSILINICLIMDYFFLHIPSLRFQNVDLHLIQLTVNTVLVYHSISRRIYCFICLENIHHFNRIWVQIYLYSQVNFRQLCLSNGLYLIFLFFVNHPFSKIQHWRNHYCSFLNHHLFYHGRILTSKFTFYYYFHLNNCHHPFFTGARESENGRVIKSLGIFLFRYFIKNLIFGCQFILQFVLLLDLLLINLNCSHRFFI